VENRAIDSDLQRELQRCSSTAIANALLQRGVASVYMQRVHALDAAQPLLIGRAFTLRFIPARQDVDSLAGYASNENLHRRAIEECPRGAVLVVDAGGVLAASSAGDLMAARLKYRGVAGMVTDGGFRDTAGIVATGLPAFQRDAAPAATPIALHPADMDVPVGCGGVAVYPGDVIFGDSDGVVVIPPKFLAEVVAAAVATADYEVFAAAQVAEGRSLFGLFPATPASTDEYRSWHRARAAVDAKGKDSK
jgi:regulator of RNase E activity RraA